MFEYSPTTNIKLNIIIGAKTRISLLAHGNGNEVCLQGGGQRTEAGEITKLHKRECM